VTLQPATIKTMIEVDKQGHDKMESMTCDCSLNGTEIQLLSLLIGMIESQSWDGLGCAIISKPTVFQSIARTLSRSTHLNGMTL
jgi:hypothetical protein